MLRIGAVSDYVNTIKHKGTEYGTLRREEYIKEIKVGKRGSGKENMKITVANHISVYSS
jgi:hypothetical protein